jgi:hypothetical protein
MKAKMFLDTVATIDRLVTIGQVLKECSSRAKALRILRLIEASLLRSSALRELHKGGNWRDLCRYLINDNINAHCSLIPDLAPVIWGLDPEVIDYVIVRLYECSLTSDSAGIIGAATTVIVEELRRVLTQHFGVDCDNAWWFEKDLITLSHTPETIVLTLCQDENDKYLRWSLSTPCLPDTMRRWIAEVIRNITNRVGDKSAVV